MWSVFNTQRVSYYSFAIAIPLLQTHNPIMMNTVSPLSDYLSFCSLGDVPVLAKRTI